MNINNNKNNIQFQDMIQKMCLGGDLSNIESYVDNYDSYVKLTVMKYLYYKL